MCKKKENPSVTAKKKARMLALQALYQWQVTQDPLEIILPQFLAHPDNQSVDLSYFVQLTEAVTTEFEKFDALIQPFLDRKIEEITPVERIILRLGTYELLAALDLPYQIILSEAVNLTKMFGTNDGYRYVNAILEKVANQIRKTGM